MYVLKFGLNYIFCLKYILLKIILFLQNELEKEVKFLQEELNDKKIIIKNLKEQNSNLFINCSKIEDENKSLKNEIFLLKEHKQDLILEVLK